ncbi:MAG: flagellar hook protein FlgE [Firmicutes bacterium]|nr:flagellar hook protein FlgE [Bacillota bacterium]
MIRSLSTAVSGLRGHQIKLDVIGNNIANVNTVAFKKSQARFEDLLSQTMQGATAPLTRGGMNPSQVGMGMRVSGILNNHFQGPIQNTDRETDLAIEGEGYFVVSDGRENFYTRDGSFGRDASGYLVNVNGLRLMGILGAGESEGSELAPIHIPLGERAVARATSQVSFAGNLDARAWRLAQGEGWGLDLGSVEEGQFSLTLDGHSVTLDYNGVDAGLIHGALVELYGCPEGLITVKGGDGLFNITLDPQLEASQLEFTGAAESPGLSITQEYQPAGASAGSLYSYEHYLFDSLGRHYFVEFIFTPTGQNSWGYEAYLDGESTSIGSGELIFDAEGNLDREASTINNLVYGPEGADSLDVISSFLGCTQLAGPSNLLVREQDGFTTGELVSFEIGRTGAVTGTYSNGMVENLGQIALSFFTNPEGLIKEGGNLYQVTSNSGEPRMGLPGTEGRGLIRSSSLEMSNADIAVEFTELITTSRAFQANTRVVTASDEILMEVINMKR